MRIFSGHKINIIPQITQSEVGNCKLRRFASESIFSGLADKGWSSSLGVGRGATTSHRKNFSTVTKCFKVPRTWTDCLVRPKLWKKDMRFDLGEIGIDGANWIRPAQDRVQWRAFVNTVMNLRVP
jgi:hypothetical protein